MALDPKLEKLLAKAVTKFLDGAAPDDKTRPRALAKFLRDNVTGKSDKEWDVADKILDDPQEISSIVQSIEAVIKAEHEATKKSLKTDHEERMESFHVDMKKSSTQGLLIGVAISISTFIFGTVLSPLGGVLFKHHLNDLDRKLHPEDFPGRKEECISPLPIVATVAMPAEPTTSEGSGKKPAAQQKVSDEVIRLQETPYGLKDPVTQLGMLDLLEQGKTVLLPKGKTGLFLRRPAPNGCIPHRLTVAPGG